MAFVPANPDIGSILEPGVFTSFNFTGSGAAILNTDRSAMLMGYRLSSGAGVADTPQLYTQQSDVNTDHGRGSEIARNFAAFNAQYGPGFEVWCTGITPPSGGAQATYVFTFAGPATTAGFVSISFAGYVISTSVAIGDTATIVCTNLYGARQAILDSGVSLTDSGSGTLTATYAHKGVTGEDYPIIVHQDGATGITISNGKITFAGAPGGSAGSITVTMGGTTVTAAIDPAVQTTAILASTAVAAAINASSTAPFTAVDDGAAHCTLFPRNDRPLRRLSVATVAPLTTVAGTISLNGTIGSGTPTLTNALTNAAALSRGFAAWVPSFGDSTSIGTLVTHGESEGNGVIQKNQSFFVASTAKLATAGAIITSASPSPTTMLNAGWSMYWVKDAPQQGFELAARYAAIYLYPAYFPQNIAGTPLATRAAVPLGAPAIIDRPIRVDREAAMSTYFMTVGLVNASGQLTIERPITCSNAANLDLHDLSTMRQIHTSRPNLNQFLTTLFTGKSFRANGVPRTSNTVTLQSIKDAITTWIQGLDDQDRFDGVDVWKSAINVAVDPVISGRVRAFVPYALIRPLYQLTPVIAPV